MTSWIADTSVAVPLLAASHRAHTTAIEAIADRSVGLAAHSALETYSVLTRLPGDARLAPSDAALLISRRFVEIVTLEADVQARLVDTFASVGVAGGAVYDAVIALTARQHDAVLLTRDRRAANTYRALGAVCEVVA